MLTIYDVTVDLQSFFDLRPVNEFKEGAGMNTTTPDLPLAAELVTVPARAPNAGDWA
ncbi:hypothetical protein [Specibacter sp. RAF43]|uniref:hypothetical protein n=1 Tax=Specibacter sp. RAF43 TaxID=3233057 RepID=UPI003F9D815A